MPAQSSGSSRVRLLLVLALVAAAAGGWYYFQSRQSTEGAPEFTTVTVARGNILQNITATGQLDPLLSVDVGSQISGLIVKLNADFNTVVKKDQIIAEIDPATYQQRLRQAEADLASSEASHRLQALNTERTRELYAKNLVTKQELDQAEAQLSRPTPNSSPAGPPSRTPTSISPAAPSAPPSTASSWPSRPRSARPSPPA